MTSRTVIDRREAFATRQRLALAASIAGFDRLTVQEVRSRIRELVAAGVSECEVARLVGFTVGQVRAQLEPDPLNHRR